MKKVIVIGLDGLEPTIVDAMLARGELPNLARLREQGGYSRVGTTTPAQTPVAWSSFATGLNPGGHGIFDFIKRDPRTYLPDLALNRYESRGAFLPPKAVNLRGGTPVWEILGEAGVGSSILRCPVTYPPDPVRGRMLAGMGVPDLRGGLGTTTFYTFDAAATPRESENVVHLKSSADGTIETHLIGPRNPKDRSDLRFPFTIRPEPAARRVVIRSAGSPAEVAIREGEWSDWLHVKFKLGLLQSIRGMVRLHLVRVEPSVELYASPVNFDPEAPLFPISHPPAYAGDLAATIGTYHTTGMVEDHTGLVNERLTEEAFLDQCDLAWREREAMMLLELERFDQGLFYCLYDTTDRVQHLFWRYGEPDHPANRGKAPDPRFSSVIADVYRRSDAIVGKALDHADDRTLLVVLSDHGFGSFRRGVNVNTILHDMGLMALRDGARPGPDCRDFFHDVDWSGTKAYALGLGGIYLNLQGREGQGQVAPGEADSVRSAIVDRLRGLVDPVLGATAINQVRTREQAYSGAFLGEAPDLLVDFAPGYRTSWGTSLGGLPEGHFEDNIKKWSGDHIIDPLLVPGVLFMNQPFRADAPDLLDLAPTILAALGVPKGAAMEGKSLLA
ncbi:alkaline phosphatase family protein [Aquisphaera insulae]|uniref:alkaline phosphatase family protein n=1 Tax=Aquisphaera insulae TaxID=2712864 RepID=UPI0013EBD1B5|nr:alkaline phosphatase family protein [Aquisphaera insulae]